MKPIIPILQGLLLTFAFNASAAVTVDLQTGRQSGTNAAMPEVTVADTRNGYTVTYTITQAEYLSSSATESGDTWSIPGFSSVENEGLPVLPYKGDSFVLPIGCTPSVTVLESEYVEFDGNIRLGNAPLFDGISQPATAPTHPRSFKSDGFYPVEIVRCEPLQVYRDRPIATVAIAPIQYDSENAKIRVYTRISYKLSYEASTRTAAQAKTLHTVSEDDPFLNSYVINGSTDSGIKRAGGTTVVVPDIMNSMLPEGYLIITTPKFQSAVAEFVKWKKRLGFNVTVKSQSDWTVNSVSNAVKSQWRKDQNLRYLLIVGGLSDVPGKQFNYIGYTDYGYASLDGDDDFIPDLYYGRIPVKTNREAEIVFNKIINYEKNPPVNDNFYSSATHCSLFSVNEPEDVKENSRRYALTTEEILAKAAAKGFNVKRHYYATDENSTIVVHPKEWSEDRIKLPSNYFNFNGQIAYRNLGCMIPDSLIFPKYSWEHSAADISESINNGSLYVLYRGHGENYGWRNPSFDTNDVLNLNNGELLPVVFSLACSTGNIGSYIVSFAETFLKKENGGCVGIFASYLPSVTDLNNYLAFGMFKSIWNECFDSKHEFDLIHKTTHDTHLGVMLNQGFAQLRHVNGSDDKVYYTQQCYNCFGDPSMRMYSSVPATINTMVNTYLVDGNTFKYSFDIPTGCRASVYNVTQDSVIVFDYLKGSVTFPKDDEISICFTGDNMRCRQWSNVPTICPMASRSAETNIMVREDRIWEHAINDRSIWNEWFEGTTTINGKTYHNLHLREIKPDNTQREFVVAYMREDQGKVYMIASKLSYEDLVIFGTAYFKNYEDELLVYDFNLTEGDTMHLTEASSPSNDLLPFGGFEIQNNQKITKKYNVEYNGNIFEAFEVTLNYINASKNSFDIIKGVGGTTSVMCFPVLYNEFDTSYGTVLNVRLYDSEKNLLFDNRYAKNLSAADVEADGGVSVEGGCVRVGQAGADCRVDIYDTCGSLVRSNLGEACSETSLEGLARGVYIVRVSGSASGCTTLKVSL